MQTKMAAALLLLVVAQAATTAGGAWGSFEHMDVKVAPGTKGKTAFAPYRSFEGG